MQPAHMQPAQKKSTSLGHTAHQMDPQAPSPPRQNTHLFDATPFVLNQPQAHPSLPHGPLPASTWYTALECAHIMNAFETSVPLSAEHARDWRRLAVLKDAIAKQDWPYLTMHQYYCMLTFNPADVPLGLRSQQSLGTAVRVMHNVLDSNDTLSPAVLHFFANFPYPLEQTAARWPAEFQRQGQLFLLFITQSPNYDPLKIMCAKRKCPPLARELSIDLKICSPTFQRLLFTAMLRVVWRQAPQSPLQARLEHDALALLQKNLADFRQREAAAHPHAPHDHDEKERALEWRVWGAALRRLGHMFETSLSSQPMPVQQPLHSPTSCRHQHPHAQSAGMLPYPSAHVRARGRPRTHSVTLPHPATLPSSRAVALQSRPGQPLLPPQGWTQPQQRQPNPARFSLHQAHLRSPVLKAQSANSPLYHFTLGYVQSPTRLTDANRAIQKWTFTMTSLDMQCIPGIVPGTPGEPETRRVDTSSRTARLRCVKWTNDELPTDHAWAIADTAWVPHSFFTFNGTSLQQRKKVHNGKDLPIDLTGLLRQGENTLEVTVMARSSDTSYLQYLVAVEMLGVESHESIKQNCLGQRRVSAAQVLQSIQDKLSRTSHDEDEIAIVQSNLTINLFDPFSASAICDIPVRSVACLHNDCFDLDTYLQTRRRKGDTSIPDQWRCPICNADARPQHLLLDGFLEDVRKTLAAQRLLETRAILVQHDGSWKPKAEVRDPNGVSDRGASDEPSPPLVALPTGQLTVSAPMEIIDLSD